MKNNMKNNMKNEINKELFYACNNLLYSASRVRNKYGKDENGKSLDWQEWLDLDDAAFSLGEILFKKTSINGIT